MENEHRPHKRTIQLDLHNARQELAVEETRVTGEDVGQPIDFWMWLQGTMQGIEPNVLDSHHAADGLVITTGALIDLLRYKATCPGIDEYAPWQQWKQHMEQKQAMFQKRLDSLRARVEALEWKYEVTPQLQQWLIPDLAREVKPFYCEFHTSK